MTSAAMPPVVYSIDTCAMVHLRDQTDRARAVASVRALIAAGRLVMCREAWDELEKVDADIFGEFRDVRDAFVWPRTGADMFPKVGAITRKYPKCSRPRANRNIADPYVIAYAKEYGHVVVTDEREHRQKIPVVCRREGIECINLSTLLEREGEAAA
jgi:hypothetical protein